MATDFRGLRGTYYASDVVVSLEHLELVRAFLGLPEEPVQHGLLVDMDDETAGPIPRRRWLAPARLRRGEH